MPFDTKNYEIFTTAMARDRANARGTWTPEEVAAADREDDLYQQDDLLEPPSPTGPGSQYIEHDDPDPAPQEPFGNPGPRPTAWSACGVDMAGVAQQFHKGKKPSVRPPR